MIRAEDIEVVYTNGTRALHPTSVEFAAGGFTVLIGASGAGKSTLLRCLNGLVTPSRGRVVVDGVGDIAEARRLRQHRRAAGMVFQQHQLIGRLSVLTNVLMGRLGYHSTLRSLLPYAKAEKRIALAAIDRVGLLSHALRRADQLSGGEQQRVGIARALVQSPRVVLADEPVASLDPATADRVLALLHGICRTDGIATIVSLHQVDFARRYADRIVGLAKGRIVFDGPPKDLGDRDVARIYGSAATEGASVAITEAEPELLLTGTY